MNIRLHSLIVFLLFNATAFAQVPNASFENWTTNLPDSWTTNNFPPDLIPITQSADAHSGLSSIKCEIPSYNGSAVPPNLISLGNNGFHVTHSYVMLYGWYKANLLGSNVGTVAINMFRGSGQMGYGYLVLTSTPQWTQFAVPISYISGQTATSAKITFTMTDSTSQPPPYQVGSYYLIDDLSLSMVNGIDDLTNFSIGVFPNPVSNVLNINGDFKSGQSYQLQLINSTGSLVLKNIVESTMNEFPPLDVSSLPEGIYMLIISDSKNALSSQRVLISR